VETAVKQCMKEMDIHFCGERDRKTHPMVCVSSILILMKTMQKSE